MAVKEKDWLTPVAVIGGGAALVIGAVLLFKKKEVLSPGDTLEVTFKFDYQGPTDIYRLRVVLGNARTLLPFDEDAPTLYEYPITIEASDIWITHQEKFSYEVPIFGEGVSDIEFSIRYSDSTIVRNLRIIARDIVRRE